MGAGRQIVCCVVGAAAGAVLWYVLSVPRDLINVFYSVFIGAGAGAGAGILSGIPRTARGPAVAVVVTAVVVLVMQAVITRHYLSYAEENLIGAPSNPNWDGAFGAVRLALDRAAGRNGWTRNASYFWWFLSLVLAGWLAWSTAPRPRTRRVVS